MTKDEILEEHLTGHYVIAEKISASEVDDFKKSILEAMDKYAKQQFDIVEQSIELVKNLAKQIVISTDPQCKHPIDKLTDWHNNSVLCLECNSIVAEQGQNLKEPIRLNITRY